MRCADLGAITNGIPASKRFCLSTTEKGAGAHPAMYTHHGQDQIIIPTNQSWLYKHRNYRILRKEDIRGENKVPKTDVEKIPLDDENTIKYLIGEGEDNDPDTFKVFDIPTDDPNYKYKARLLGRLLPVLPEKHRKGFITVPPNCKSDDQITIEIYLSPDAEDLYSKLVEKHL